MLTSAEPHDDVICHQTTPLLGMCGLRTRLYLYMPVIIIARVFRLMAFGIPLCYYFQFCMKWGGGGGFLNWKLTTFV